jgi:hypothetical protein
LLFAAIRNRNPGIHPGWPVGIELVIFGGNIVAAFFIASEFREFGDPYLYPYYGPLPLFLRPLKIAILFFVGVFT